MKRENKVIKINDDVPDVIIMPAKEYEDPELKIVFIEAKEEPTKYCAHERIRIWKYHRLIQCFNCGQTLDAFEYLVMIGTFENNKASHLKNLHYEVKWKLEEIEQLKKQIAKLKSEKRHL